MTDEKTTEEILKEYQEKIDALKQEQGKIMDEMRKLIDKDKEE